MTTGSSTKSTLVVVTTYDYADFLDKTLRSLGRLECTFDVVVVDDHSSGPETAAVCERHAVPLVGKAERKGLTHSWNLAYAQFKNSDYRHCFISNNDVLVPDGALEAMIGELAQPRVLVSPLSNPTGVPYNPMQSVISYFEDITPEQAGDPDNFQAIQDRLTRADLPPREVSRDSIRPPNLNGFFFGFNRDIFSCEVEPDCLFDPRFINVGNEVDLSARLMEHGFQELLCLDSFVFHYKGVTLKCGTDRNLLD